jgi:hypothetical protein
MLLSSCRLTSHYLCCNVGIYHLPKTGDRYTLAVLSGTLMFILKTTLRDLVLPEEKPEHLKLITRPNHLPVIQLSTITESRISATFAFEGEHDCPGDEMEVATAKYFQRLGRLVQSSGIRQVAVTTDTSAFLVTIEHIGDGKRNGNLPRRSIIKDITLILRSEQTELFCELRPDIQDATSGGTMG